MASGPASATGPHRRTVGTGHPDRSAGASVGRPVTMSTEAELPALTSRRRVLGAGIWVGASSWVNRLMLVGVLAVLAGQLTPRQFGMLSVAGLCRNRSEEHTSELQSQSNIVCRLL